MKKLTLLISITCFTVVAFAQSEKYMASMKSNIAAIDTSFKNPANLLALANKFERIAIAEKNQWLAYYYAALCQVNYTYMEQDKTKIDAIADKASELIDKADSLQPNNSEISCIKSMIASSHMMVNPMQRYMEYGPESASYIEAAMQQDPTNPRPEYLKGQGLKYTHLPFYCCHQLARRSLQRTEQFQNHAQGWRLQPPLKLANIGPVNLRSKP